ncbi:MAG: hypothetical protein ACOCX5_02820 [Chloroflexota bacterium]
MLKNKRAIVERTIKMLEESESAEASEPITGLATAPQAEPPWVLQQFFKGEIDLDMELSNRSSNMPVMATIKFRGLGTRTGRGVATLTTQDGAAQVIFDADRQTGVVQVSFTFGSMLTLRFKLHNLVDRRRWLELMRREAGGLAFLWGPDRWEQDYAICISRRYFTNFYTFSPHGFEAATRLTPEVTGKLLDWLESFWQEDEEKPDQDSPPMLTW